MMYCTGTIELNQFPNPLMVVDAIKTMNFEGTFENDVIFLGTNLEDESAAETALSLAYMLRPYLVDDHEQITISVDGDDDINNFEVILKDKYIYFKQAILIQ